MSSPKRVAARLSSATPPGRNDSEGERDVLGRSLIVKGDLFTVVGVLPAGFHFFDGSRSLGAAVGGGERTHQPALPQLVRDRSNGPWCASLHAASSPHSISIPEQPPIRLPGSSNGDKGLHLDGLHSALVEGFRPSLLLAFGSRRPGPLHRLRECRQPPSRSRIHTRIGASPSGYALGATRTQLTRQLLVELFVLALAAGFLGVVIAVWIQKFIIELCFDGSIGSRRFWDLPQLMFWHRTSSFSVPLGFGFLGWASSFALPREQP